MNIKTTIMNYLKNTFLFFLIVLFSCENTSQEKPVNNDLWTLNAPQGTKTMQEKMLIYKEATGELILKSTTDVTFTDKGNYKTHTQSFPDGTIRSQEYRYNDKDQITTILDKKGSEIVAETNYKYAGRNPLEIYTTVAGANNYFPKIIKYFEDDVLIREERFDANNKLIDLYEYSKNQNVHTNFGHSDNMRFKYVVTLKNGYEVKSVRYNSLGEQGSGRESELDAYGNVVTSWVLDKTGKREKESNGYRYLYKNKSWTIRASTNAIDYGSGKTRTLYTRSFTGKETSSVEEKEVLAFLKKL